MKVLIAIETSQCSQAAFDAVVRRPWPESTEFEIVTVVEPLVVGYVYADSASSRAVEEAQTAYINSCRQFLGEKTRLLAECFPDKTVSCRVLEGRVAESIVDEARRLQADLIILGSHGRRGLNRFFLGSVAEKVATLAPCSIEIVRRNQSATAPTETAPLSESAPARKEKCS